MLEHIAPERVALLPGLFEERRKRNTECLLSMDVEALLQSYALEAGADMRDTQEEVSSWLHWGWEAPYSGMRGHFLGYWMSAAAFLVRSEDHRRLRAQLYDITDRLREYQIQNGGRWIGPVPEKYFELLFQGKSSVDVQYVMQKLLMGLLDVYEATSYEPAMEILSHISDWYADYFAHAGKTEPSIAYQGGAGGMLEIWARLYRLSGEEKYRDLLKRYEFPSLFEELREGKDPLSGASVKDTISWVLGAARIYEIKHSEEWLEILSAFWKCSQGRRRAYSTGGADSDGLWIPPNLPGEYAGSRTQEFCGAFLMVRLADDLFRFTGEAVYADRIERLLYNAFLAQQNKENGLPADYLPMEAGSRKSWETARRSFHCCFGSMLQAQSMVNHFIFYRDDDRVTIAQYIPSKAAFKLSGTDVEIEIRSSSEEENGAEIFPGAEDWDRSGWGFKIRIRCSRPRRFLLRLRIPSWVKGMPLVSIDGKRRFVTEEVLRDGFLKIDREWEGQEVRIAFSPELYMEALPDRPARKAVLEGPVVLAALSDVVYLPEEAKRMLQKQSGIGERKRGHYTLSTAEREISFVPIYELTDEAYTIYCNTK